LTEIEGLGELKTEGVSAKCLAGLMHVSQGLSRNSSLEGLFDDLTAELKAVLPFDGLGIIHYSETTNSNTWIRCQIRGQVVGIDDYSPGGTVTDTVYKTQKPLALPSLSREKQFSATTAWLQSHGMQAIYAFPLTTVHRKLGVFVIVAAHPQAYAEADLTLLALVASQVALAMDNVLHVEDLRRAVNDVERKKERLALLLDLNNAITSKLELSELFHALTVNLRRVLRCDGVGVQLPDVDTGKLRIECVDFPVGKGSIRDGLQIEEHSDAFAYEAFRTGRVVHVKGQQLAAGLPPVYDGLRSVVHIPVISKGRILGTLTHGSFHDDAFAIEDIVFSGQVADQVAIAIDNALAYQEMSKIKTSLALENVYLESEIRDGKNFGDIVGDSSSLRKVLAEVETVAGTDSTVLIYGETGTGKELIARAVHDMSLRKDKAFVTLNCAALPAGLIESELFGHERGAFTGAVAQRIGRIEIANGGTIFLDEIGELPIELQPKLLRVLQEREFERLGGVRTVKANVRLIAATNRDLEEMVCQHQFRADLFYRLNVFPISMPPLRDRPEDIPALVRHFVKQFALRMNKRVETIPPDTLAALIAYSWPGNIRELQNFMERAVILSRGSVLDAPLGELRDRRAAHPEPGANGTLEEAEKRHILHVLGQTHWVVGGANGAAAQLGMNRSTLNSKLRKLGIARPE
jgi:formate hydrogenlyase transcriptional activator